MNKIDELIQDLCPEGVRSIHLGSLGRRNKGTPITASRMKELHQEGAPIRIFAGGKTVADFPADALPEKNIINEPSIIVKSRGHIGFEYYDKPFSHKNELWSYTIDTSGVDQKFVYYYLLTKIKSLQELARATSVKLPQLSVKDTDSLKIPIPPLEVQKEIVSILDKFTQLEAELSAELEARREQYEYYRNQLLTFDEEGGVRWTTLGEVAIKISSGGTPKTSDTSYYGGEIPWLRTQEVDFKEIWDTGVKISESGLKNSSAKLIPKDCVIIAMYGATVGKSAINKIPLSTNQACANIQVNPEIADYKYVFHWVNHNYKNIKALGTGSQTNINAQTVRNFKIPVPEISEQKRIVTILNKFDDLVNDISAGLPVEINARRQQYEYYRTKLLTFQELSV